MLFFLSVLILENKESLRLRAADSLSAWNDWYLERPDRVNSGKQDAPHSAKRPFQQTSYPEVTGCRRHRSARKWQRDCPCLFDVSTWKNISLSCSCRKAGRHWRSEDHSDPKQLAATITAADSGGWTTVLPACRQPDRHCTRLVRVSAGDRPPDASGSVYSETATACNPACCLFAKHGPFAQEGPGATVSGHPAMPCGRRQQPPGRFRLVDTAVADSTKHLYLQHFDAA